MKAQEISDQSMYTVLSTGTVKWLIGGWFSIVVFLSGWLLIHQEWKGEVNGAMKQFLAIQRSIENSLQTNARTLEAHTKMLGDIANDISFMKGKEEGRKIIPAK